MRVILSNLKLNFIKNFQDTLEESFMGTMRTLIDAPETSPLAMVNLEDIGLFYIQLTRYIWRLTSSR